MILLIVAFAILIAVPIRKGILKNNRELGTSSETIVSPSFALAAYTGLVAVAVMSWVNFPFQAPSCFCLLIIYIAEIVNFLMPHKTPQPTKSLYRWLLGIALLISATLFSIDEAKKTYGDHVNKQANRLCLVHRPAMALQKLPFLQNDLYYYESYWKNYAAVLIYLKNYKAGIAKLREAKKYSSAPILYEMSGYCFQCMHDYKTATKDYQQAIDLEPYRFKNRIVKMRLLLLQHDSLGARNEAALIYNMNIKISSLRAANYKREALHVLHLASRQASRV